MSNSASYARNSKDTLTATYLAEEAVELLQNQYDSLYVYCNKNPTATNPGQLCEQRAAESTTGQTSWRLFKERLGPVLLEPSCYKTTNPDGTAGNPDGCSFDMIDMVGDITTTPTRYVASDTECPYLVRASTTIATSLVRNMFVCKGVPAHHGTASLDTSKPYTRKVYVEQLATFEVGLPNTQYQDDLRITVTVSFRGINGTEQVVSVVRFIHARP